MIDQTQKITEVTIALVGVQDVLANCSIHKEVESKTSTDSSKP
jgi:hypothetical protein